MTNTKGSRLDTAGVRIRASVMVTDTWDRLEQHTQDNRLTPTERILADTVRSLHELLVTAVKTVERDYAAQDAREEARAAVAQPLTVAHTRELRWTRQDESTWDCMAGDDLWVLNRPNSTGAWYLVHGRGDTLTTHLAPIVDARLAAHRMIKEYYAAEGDDA